MSLSETVINTAAYWWIVVMCAPHSWRAHSRTRDCDAVAKRFEFLPLPLSLSLSRSIPFRSPGETGGVCTRARRIVLDVAGDICWLAFGRDYPNLLGFPPSLSLFLSLSLNYSKSNLQASVRNECKNELDVMSERPSPASEKKGDTMAAASRGEERRGDPWPLLNGLEGGGGMRLLRGGIIIIYKMLTLSAKFFFFLPFT